MHVIISDRAIADLRNIVDFVARSSQEAAERLLDELVSEATAIGAHPEAFAAVEGVRSLIRRKNVRTWAIFYRVLATHVEVIRIAHGGRNLRWLQLDR